MRNLSQVNSEFRNIVNSERFTKFVLDRLMKKLDIEPLFAAALIASPSAFKWVRDNISEIGFLRFTAFYRNFLRHKLKTLGDSLGIKFINEVFKRYDDVTKPLSKAVNDKDVNLLKQVLNSISDFTPTEKAAIILGNYGLSTKQRSISFLKMAILDLDPGIVELLLQFAKDNLTEDAINEIFNEETHNNDSYSDYWRLSKASAETLAKIIELLKRYGPEDSWLLQKFSDVLKEKGA